MWRARGPRRLSRSIALMTLLTRPWSYRLSHDARCRTRCAASVVCPACEGRAPPHTHTAATVRVSGERRRGEGEGATSASEAQGALEAKIHVHKGTFPIMSRDKARDAAGGVQPVATALREGEDSRAGSHLHGSQHHQPQRCCFQHDLVLSKLAIEPLCLSPAARGAKACSIHKIGR